MGKGFNNYMCKKFFHPASADNLKRVWIAQKKSDAEKKKQDDLRTQYDREQELYTNKALLSKESKERLELNFMYEPPPGVKKIGETDNEGAEPEYKFEWQRTWGHAPKESYLEKGDDFNEQPFGIQVCQAKCIKCGKFGHMNTDKRCTLYGKAVDSDAPIASVDQNKLLEEMRAEGLAMRYSSWELTKAEGPNHLMVTEKEEKPLIDRAQLLKSMTKEEKKKLLKKLKKMEEGGTEKKAKKAKKDKKKKKSKRRSNSSESEARDDRKRQVESERHRGGRSSSPQVKKEKRSPSPDRRKNRSGSSSRKRSPSRERRRERSASREDRRRDRSRSRDLSKKRDRSGSRHRDRSGSRDRRRQAPDRREERRDRPSKRDRHNDSIEREIKKERV